MRLVRSEINNRSTLRARAPTVISRPPATAASGPEANRSFLAETPLPFLVLSDLKGEVARALAVVAQNPITPAHMSVRDYVGLEAPGREIDTLRGPNFPARQPLYSRGD